MMHCTIHTIQPFVDIIFPCDLFVLNNHLETFHIHIHVTFRKKKKIKSLIFWFHDFISILSFNTNKDKI